MRSASSRRSLRRRRFPCRSLCWSVADRNYRVPAVKVSYFRAERFRRAVERVVFNPENRSPAVLTSAERIDSRHVDTALGELAQMVRQGAGTVVTLNEEAGFLRFELQAGFFDDPAEATRIVGDDVDLRAASTFGPAAAQEIDVGAYERRQNAESL